MRSPLAVQKTGDEVAVYVERELISEHTQDGIAAARTRGRRSGRPPLDR